MADYFYKLQANFKWFITTIVLLSLLAYVIGLLIEPALQNDFSLFDKFLFYLSSTLTMLGTAGITAAVFQVIIKSTAFMNVLKDTLDTDKRNWKKYSDTKIKEVLNAIQRAKKFVQVSYIDEKEKSIKLAKKTLLKRIQEARKKHITKRNEHENKLLEKNYIIEESRIIKTILKNGCEITTFELDIRFFKKGSFTSYMENWTDNKQIKYPKFSIFLENEKNNRFSDFSFSATYFNLHKKDRKIASDRYATLKIIGEDNVNNKGFSVTLQIDDTFEDGDFFTLSFSTTIKDIFTEENIRRINDGKVPKPYSSSGVPVGVRKIIIQEEIYGNQDIYTNRIRPSLMIDDEYIEPSLQTQSIFYKKHEWVLLYKDTQYEKISYSVI